MFPELESSRHKVGSSFDYFAHDAAMGYARSCPCEYRRCLRLVHLALVSVCLPLSAHLSAISLKNSPLCDLIMTRRVDSPKSILALSNSRISRRMSPFGDALIDGWIPSPIHFWIAIRRHLESVSRNRSPPKWQKCESFRGNGLGSRRQERAMDRMDQPCTSIDERVLSGRRAVMIV